MIVLYWMTPEPVVVRPESTLLDVYELTLRHKVRRLPVARSNDELCGIISRSDAGRFLPPETRGTSLSGEHAELLRQHRVADVMIQNPITCDADDPIEEVCRIMCREKVGALPVLKRGHLVGIISESDLLRALAELAHEGEGGKRITLRLPMAQHKDALYSIVDLCRRFHLELLAVLTHTILDESASLATLRVDGDTVDAFVKALWEAGYKVTSVA